MGKSLTIALTLLFLCDGMTADAQLFKKWKKKKQQQVEVAEVPQAVNLDTLQLPMADIATCSDNRFNRMAFLGIPLGISAKGFHDRLTAQGFSEPADQQNYYYLYQGTAYGGQLRLILMQSDSTRTVYAVDIEETTIRQTEADVRRRFYELKQQLRELYGDGYVCNSGEQYIINTPLGSVTLHYERTTGGGGFVIGYAIEDAKASRLEDMESGSQGVQGVQGVQGGQEIKENGLVEVVPHADIAGLGQMLLQAATPQRARLVLSLYDYTIGKETAALLPASFRMGDYLAKVSISKKTKMINAVTITANDRADLVKADLELMGYSLTPDPSPIERGGKETGSQGGKEPSYSNGVLTASLQEAADGQLVLTFAKAGSQGAKETRRQGGREPRRGGRRR